MQYICLKVFLSMSVCMLGVGAGSGTNETRQVGDHCIACLDFGAFLKSKVTAFGLLV